MFSVLPLTWATQNWTTDPVIRWQMLYLLIHSCLSSVSELRKKEAILLQDACRSHEIVTITKSLACSSWAHNPLCQHQTCFSGPLLWGNQWFPDSSQSIFNSEMGLYAFLSQMTSWGAVKMDWIMGSINYSAPPSCWKAVLSRSLISDKLNLGYILLQQQHLKSEPCWTGATRTWIWSRQQPAY